MAMGEKAQSRVDIARRQDRARRDSGRGGRAGAFEETGLRARELTFLMRYESPVQVHYVFEAQFADAPRPAACHEIADCCFAHLDQVSELKSDIRPLIQSLLACDRCLADSVR